MVTLVSWLQEKSSMYFDIEDTNTENKEEIETSSQTFTRYWIYSHHIYSNVSCILIRLSHVSITMFLDEEKEHFGSGFRVLFDWICSAWQAWDHLC